MAYFDCIGFEEKRGFRKNALFGASGVPKRAHPFYYSNGFRGLIPLIEPRKRIFLFGAPLNG
jgi:hypothetical protein